MTIEDGDRTRMFVVANKDVEGAKKLALASSGGGTILTYAEMFEGEIASLCMEANEVKVSTVLTPERNA